MSFLNISKHVFFFFFFSFFRVSFGVDVSVFDLRGAERRTLMPQAPAAQDPKDPPRPEKSKTLGKSL